MDKLDFKKKLSELYNPKNTEWELVFVPKMQFLMIDGRGDPNTSQNYREAIEALYSLAYALKFMSKKNLNKDYTVPPLEGLWTADDMDVFQTAQKDKYQWTMMIMQPEWITPAMVAEATEVVGKKKNPPCA